MKKKYKDSSLVQQLLNNRTLVLGLAFIAFAGAAIAAENAGGKNFLDLFADPEEATKFIAEQDFFNGPLMNAKPEQICPEIISMTQLCRTICSNFFVAEGGKVISDCAAGGNASNQAGFVCNMAKALWESLPTDMADQCINMMADQVFGK